MKIRINYPIGQVSKTVFFLLIFAACGSKKQETPVIPPPTSPLSQAYIGYGVINVSYTRVNTMPEEDSTSPGYLRRGSVVCITERRLSKNDGKSESWVLVEGAYSGWLRETLMDIYDNEMQAETASRLMGR